MPGGSYQVGPMIGASSVLDGSPGIIPKPLAGEENRVLKGNGTFASDKVREYDDAGGDSSGAETLLSTAKSFKSNKIFIGGNAAAVTTALATISNSFLQTADFNNNTVFYAEAKLSMIKTDGTAISGARRTAVIRKNSAGNLFLDYHPAAEIVSAVLSAFAFSVGSSSPTIEFTTGAGGAGFKWAIEVKYTALTIN